jgi:hypothetical protein
MSEGLAMSSNAGNGTERVAYMGVMRCIINTLFFTISFSIILRIAKGVCEIWEG